MDDATREGVQAYYRLRQALLSVVADPAQRLRATDHTDRLSAVAREANTAMEMAGLLGADPAYVLGLVRQLYPHLDEQKI